MQTAQGGVVSALLYVVVLMISLRTAYRRTDGLTALLRRPHPAAVGLWLVVAVPSLVQLARPGLFDVLSRQPSLVERGQVWRLVTSVVVQDGGVTGTVFNLVVLALTLPAAVALWRATPAAVLFVVGALVFNLPAAFLWHVAGGGNSGATFFLATSLVGLLLIRDRGRGLRLPAVVLVVAGVVLLVLGDAHGVAVLAGLVVGGVTATRAGRAASGRAASPRGRASS